MAAVSPATGDMDVVTHAGWGLAGLWIDIGRVLAQSDCWIRCMKLDIATQDEAACKLRCVELSSPVHQDLRGKD